MGVRGGVNMMNVLTRLVGGTFTKEQWEFGEVGPEVGRELI